MYIYIYVYIYIYITPSVEYQHLRVFVLHLFTCTELIVRIEPTWRWSGVPDLGLSVYPRSEGCWWKHLKLCWKWIASIESGFLKSVFSDLVLKMDSKLCFFFKIPTISNNLNTNRLNVWHAQQTQFSLISWLHRRDNCVSWLEWSHWASTFLCVPVRDGLCSCAWFTQ